jgi:Icc protein
MVIPQVSFIGGIRSRWTIGGMIERRKLATEAGLQTSFPEHDRSARLRSEQTLLSNHSPMPLHCTPLSRRAFLSRTLLGGVAVFTARLGSGATPGAEERWALLADTHIAANPAQIARQINMADQLAAEVAEVKALAGSGIRHVLVNGDCSLDRGEPGDYTTFIELTKPLVEAGMSLHCLMGNHDERNVFWEAFQADAALPRPVEGKHISVIESGVANWFLLDSLEVTKKTPGTLGADQLQWLAQALDARPDKPALVMCHHDFIPRLDGKPPGLTDTPALMAVLKPRKQVKAVFCGHTHKWRAEQEEGLHLINLPTVAYGFTPTELTGWVDCRLARDGMRLEQVAYRKDHASHGKVTELAWRA